jgi:hypothetical protein
MWDAMQGLKNLLLGVMVSLKPKSNKLESYQFSGILPRFLATTLT